MGALVWSESRSEITRVRARFGDRLASSATEVVDGLGEPLTAAFDVVERTQHRGSQAGVFPVGVEVHDPVQFVVVEYRPVQQDLAARRGGGLQQVLLGTHHPEPSVTISSRIASSGGLVTWAKSSTK